ncbi:MAG: hypothetical protein IKW83_09125 [Muribaculaceae bacterium]|nr:hypothetical protein [Muribaculaceae bacterium]
MKINIIPTIIAVAVSALIGLLAAHLCGNTSKATTIGITTGVSLAVTLLPMLAIKSGDERLDINIRVVSSIFVTLVLLVNFIVCLNVPQDLIYYFIFIGLILLIYIGVIYSLVNRSTE